MLSGFDLPKRVLVVSPDAEIQDSIQTALKESSASVEGAHDQAEGLETFFSWQPDMVLVDLSSDASGGLTFVRRLRDDFLGFSVPVVVLCKGDSLDWMKESASAGVDDFLKLPVDAQALRERVVMARARSKIERDASPLTGLPGSVVLRRAVERKLADDAPWAVIEIDIDNFRDFNELRGFEAGDDVLVGMAEILREYAVASSADVFVAHLGSDDFACLLPIKEVANMSEQVFHRFNAMMKSHYLEDEQKEASAAYTTRTGDLKRVALLTLSINGVNTERVSISDHRRVEHVLHQTRNVAKGRAGHTWFMDRRND